jgi:predicted nucleotidyltransferase component of viral defense system
MNLSASVHQRLLNLSHERQENFNLLLERFAVERLLYRMSRSGQAERFVLKGARLFALWAVPVHRPTRDLDLLGFGDNSSEGLLKLFQEVCRLEVEPDGLSFDVDSIRVRQIREDQIYSGQRVELVALLGRARVPIQVDIGFGDLVSPRAVDAEYPTLLDFPAPHLRVYTRESVIAEKLHAMVILDLTNSRMKDFYDLWTMSRLFHFEGRALVEAIHATFKRRQTTIPSAIPLALTASFGANVDKISQWQGFLRRSQIDTGGVTLLQVITDLNDFLRNPLMTTSPTDFIAVWPPGGPWIKI